MLRKLLTLVAATAVTFGAVDRAKAAESGPPIVLKVATLAPKTSEWGKQFGTWAQEVKDQSGGRLELQFFPDSQQGDEAAMVGKIRSGQLQGAALTSTGLGVIYPSVMVFQLPGLFPNVEALDRTRNTMRRQLDSAFEEQGFTILGWGDVGEAHLMSKGFAVHKPEDMKQRKCFTLPGNEIEMAVYSLIPGGVQTVKVSLPEVTTNLQTGAIEVVNAPALAAEQLMWAQKLEYINTQPSGYGIGAIIFSSKLFTVKDASGKETPGSLAPDLQAILRKTGDAAGVRLTTKIRQLDKESFARLSSKMKSYTLTDAEKAQWVKLFADTRDRVKTKFNPKVFNRAIACAEKPGDKACTDEPQK